MTKAIKITKLPKADRQEIDRRILDGEYALTVVKEFIPKADRELKTTPRDTYKKLIGFLSKHLPVLEGDVDSLFESARATRTELAILQRCSLLVGRLEEHQSSSADEDA